MRTQQAAANRASEGMPIMPFCQRRIVIVNEDGTQEELKIYAASDEQAERVMRASWRRPVRSVKSEPVIREDGQLELY